MHLYTELVKLSTIQKESMSPPPTILLMTTLLFYRNLYSKVNSYTISDIVIIFKRMQETFVSQSLNLLKYKPHVMKTCMVHKGTIDTNHIIDVFHRSKLASLWTIKNLILILMYSPPLWITLIFLSYRTFMK